ncbi:MAG: hypothetical protein ACM3S2_12445, partial [Ignavibacteriales bacterium]
VFKLAKKNKMIPFYVRLTEFSFYIKILKTMQQAWRMYKIRTFPGEITLFRSEENSANNAQSLDMGWGNYAAKGINIVDIQGNHISMMQPPNVKLLAGHLNAALIRSRGKLELKYDMRLKSSIK